jgi:hypothetical protein
MKRALWACLVCVLILGCNESQGPQAITGSQPTLKEFGLVEANKSQTDWKHLPQIPKQVLEEIKKSTPQSLKSEPYVIYVAPPSEEGTLDRYRVRYYAASGKSESHEIQVNFDRSKGSIANIEHVPTPMGAGAPTPEMSEVEHCVATFFQDAYLQGAYHNAIIPISSNGWYQYAVPNLDGIFNDVTSSHWFNSNNTLLDGTGRHFYLTTPYTWPWQIPFLLWKDAGYSGPYHFDLAPGIADYYNYNWDGAVWDNMNDDLSSLVVNIVVY